MSRYISLGIAMLASAAFGAVAVGGLHAQAKPKAYSVGELEPLDAAGQSAYLIAARAAITSAGGHILRTTSGRVVGLEGPPPPKSVALIEWDSLEQAQTFYSSKAWTDLAPQRDKAQKTIRRYVVEVEK